MIRGLLAATLGLSMGVSGTALAGGEACRLAAERKAAAARQEAKESVESLLLRLLVKDLAHENREVQAGAELKLILAGEAAIPFARQAPPEAKERAERVISKIEAIARQSRS